MNSNSDSVLHFRLGQLSDMTGLSAQVIRVWESRYGFPKASRTDGGHRRYSPQQAEQLRRAALLARSGFRAKDAIAYVRAEASAPLPPARPAGPLQPARFARLLLDGDVPRALAQLRGSWLALGVETTLQDQVFPALRWIGDEWAAGRASVAQEHVATGIVLSWLGSVRSELPWKRQSPRLLLATPEGEEHALGIWVLELLLTERGVSALALGANVPTADLVKEVTRREPEALVLGIMRPRLKHAVNKVARALDQVALANPPGVFAGGPGARDPLPSGVRRLPEELWAAAEWLVSTYPRSNTSSAARRR